MAVAIIGILGAKVWIGLATASVWEDAANVEEVQPKHLDSSAHETPSIALACAKREALRMADIAQTMVRNVAPILQSGDTKLQTTTSDLDKGLDTLFDAIKIYMAQTMQNRLTQQESQQALLGITPATSSTTSELPLSYDLTRVVSTAYFHFWDFGNIRHYFKLVLIITVQIVWCVDSPRSDTHHQIRASWNDTSQLALNTVTPADGLTKEITPK